MWLQRKTELDAPTPLKDRQTPRNLDKLDLAELRLRFDAIRQEIKREDDLVNQRNTWCILSTTALVAGILTAAVKAQEINQDLIVAILMLTFSTAGLRMATLCSQSVDAAKRQIEYLFGVYSENAETFLEAGLFRPFGDPDAHRDGISYSKQTPRILARVWSVIFVVSLGYAGVTGYSILRSLW